MDLIGAPSFIRNIISVPRQLQDIIVPNAFVKDNPTIFPGCTSVVLQVPGGPEFKVEVKREGREILFSGGWKDFAKHYEVDLGYFLVFRYRGNSSFQVGIADTSNYEIDYAPFHCQCVPYQQTESEEATEEDDEEEEENTNREMVTSAVLERAEMYPCNGPNFIVSMNISYVSNDYRMWVPLAHGQRYLKNGSSKVKLVVDVANGGTATWKVNVVSGRTSVRFGAGWKKFVKSNRLNENDVCKFELIDRAKQTYKVHIFNV